MSAPIQSEYRKEMNAIASFMDEYFNGPNKGASRKVGFCLLLYEFGEKEFNNRLNYISNGADRKDGEKEFNNRLNYISNGADRKDIVCMFKEMIRRFEGQPDVTGRA